MPSPRGVEEYVGVESLHSLHARRDAIVAELAPLEARYGDWRIAEAERKIVLAKCELKIRLASEKKLTDKHYDAEAHTHPEYESWVHRAIGERTRMVVLQNTVANIGERIRRDDQTIRFATQELTLQGRGP